MRRIIFKNLNRQIISLSAIIILILYLFINITGCSARENETTDFNIDSSNIAEVSEDESSQIQVVSSDESNCSFISEEASEQSKVLSVDFESPADVSSVCDTVAKIKAENLMDYLSSQNINGKSADEKFIKNTADFSIELFKKSINEGQNSLISPLSVMLALSMTANGADNETLSQMEKVLGGDISINELNEYLYSYINSLPNNDFSKINIANSIWFRDDSDYLTVNNDFLQKNADYYNAAVYKSAFNDQTVIDINNWVKNKTDGKLDKIIDKIDDNAVMYLINNIMFNSQWLALYNEKNIYEGEFTAGDGINQTVTFMRSRENVYLDDGEATGFIKPYVQDAYSFVALLPNEGISINDYLASLTGEKFLNMIKGVKKTGAIATIPKFGYDYNIEMNDALISLGMPNAFSPVNADFNKLGKSTAGNIFISKLFQKSFITVDEFGTSAGATTVSYLIETSAPLEMKNVTLDRPFIYAIIDNKTSLPIFIGTVMNI